MREWSIGIVCIVCGAVCTCPQRITSCFRVTADYKIRQNLILWYQIEPTVFIQYRFTVPQGVKLSCEVRETRTPMDIGATRNSPNVER